MGVLFEQYGRIKDMKGLNRHYAPPIEEIEAYAKKVGLCDFQYMPGYKYGQFPLASKTAVNCIAWGLARAQVRDKGDVCPKSWLSKNFYSSINRFIDAVTSRYVAATGTHMAASIKI
jgi:hypothetical protein